MPDFNKYTNYTAETAFSGVVFGAQAPVLEVELNELQEIFNSKLRLLSSIIGGNLLVPSNGSITYNKSNGVLSILNCVVVSEGFFVQVPSAQVTLSATNKFAYLRLEEKVADYQTVLKSYGNTAGKTINNPIIDPRVGVETSRRKVITYALHCGPLVPKTVESVHIVKVGTLSGDVFKMENMVDSITTVMNNLLNVDVQYHNKKLSLTFTKGSGLGVSPVSASLPIASAHTLGAVKVGAGLNVSADGTLSTNVDAQSDAVVSEIMKTAATTEDVNAAFRDLGVDPTPDDPTDD